jgi:hypothetical protein
MTLREFNDLVGPCSDKEIDRLRMRYQRYYRLHRELFVNVLRGKFSDDDEFRQATLQARIKASKAGETSAKPVEAPTPKSFGAFGRTNARKFIKLATRILYLRMTGGVGCVPGGPNLEPWPLPCDNESISSPAVAKRKLIKEMEPWSVGYEAIRKRHTPFEIDE